MSLVGVVLWGTLAGSMLPFVLRRLGFDPASASAPFVATLVDVTGLVIYFTVATLFCAASCSDRVRAAMFATRVYHYRDPAAVILGLKELRKQGLTPRGLLFVALDPRGETYIAVPEDLDAVASIRVGDKLSLVPPFEGRYFHFDAVHRLPGDTVLWNGDRRLGDTGSAPEVACAISEWLKGSSAKNVFLGCTPHVPGSWWTVDHLSAVTELHALGFLDCVVTTTGILARKIDDARLFHLEFQALAQHGSPTEGWTEVFTSRDGQHPARRAPRAAVPARADVRARPRRDRRLRTCPTS